MSALFNDIIKAANTADDAVVSLFKATEGDSKQRRRMYIWTLSTLTAKFGKQAALSALNSYALFDMFDDNKSVSRAASYLHHRFERFCKIPAFKGQLLKTGMIGVDTGDLLYVAHHCVKPNSKKYQVTCFAKGIGPISDTQYDDEDTVLNEAFPIESTLLTATELTSVEQNYLPV